MRTVLRDKGGDGTGEGHCGNEDGDRYRKEW